MLPSYVHLRLLTLAGAAVCALSAVETRSLTPPAERSSGSGGGGGAPAPPPAVVRGYRLLGRVASGGPATLAQAASLARGSRAQARQGAWLLEARLGRGHVGEVYRALREGGAAGVGGAGAEEDGEEAAFVLKRLPAAAAGALASGRREIYYGTRLAHPHASRFVEAWADAASGDLWLAFRDEGVSLQALLYDAARPPADAGASSAGAGAGAGGAAPVDGSAFFSRLHRDLPVGAGSVRALLAQVLSGLAHLHARGIVHRDVKPSNILVSVGGGRVRFKRADFGSAVGGGAPAELYEEQAGGTLPGTQGEETAAYAPPEVRLSDNGAPYDALAPASYDIWSLGIVVLEVVLGTPADRLLELDARAAARAAARAPAGGSDGGGGGSAAAVARATLAEGLRALLCVPCELGDFRQALRRAAWRRHWQVRAADAKAAHAAAAGTAIVPREPPGGLSVVAGAAAAALDRLRGTAVALQQQQQQQQQQHAVAASGELVALAGSAAAEAAEAQRQLVRSGDLDALLADLEQQQAQALALQDVGDAAAAGACAATSSASALTAVVDEGDGDGAEAAGAAPSCTIAAPTPLLGARGEELLHRMLAFEPDARATAAEALAHAYFSGGAAAAAAGAGAGAGAGAA